MAQGRRRRWEIIIDDAQVGTGGVSDFTVFLTRNQFPDEMCAPTGAYHAQADGADIGFTSDADGLNELACEQDFFEYDSSDGAGDGDVRYQVKVPALAGPGSGDTTIYVEFNTPNTTALPDRDATYGSKAAWDSSHCHRYSFNQDPTGTPPQYTDSVADRHAVAILSPAQVTGKYGSAVDGNGSALALAGPSAFVMPNNASSVPATNTGLTVKLDEPDVIFAHNFDDGTIMEIDIATGELIDEWSVGGSRQGFCWNPVDEVFAVAPASGGTLDLYTRNGTSAGTFAAASAVALAICWDHVDEHYWHASTGQIKSYSRVDGSTIDTVTILGAAGGKAIDGITHCPTRDTLYITVDSGDMIYEIDKTTGDTLNSFNGRIDIEHPAATASKLYVNADGRYHHAGVSENCVDALDLDDGSQPWRVPQTEYSLECWLKPDAIAVNDPIAYLEASLSGYFQTTFQVRTGGVVRIYDSSVATADTAGGTITTGSWQYFRLTYDSGASTLTLYKNGSQVAQKTSATMGVFNFAMIGFGGRPQRTTFHNGAIDDFRLHNSARSAAWWTTRLNNTNDPDTFASLGSQIEVLLGNSNLTLLGVG